MYIGNPYGNRFFKYMRFLSVIDEKRLGRHPPPRGGPHFVGSTGKLGMSVRAPRGRVDVP